MKIRFEWDGSKDRTNRAKLGVTFDEARTVFYDDNARVIGDPGHSDDEDRFALIGLSTQLRVLVVIHCYRKNDEVIRIISARKAAVHERKEYGELAR